MFFPQKLKVLLVILNTKPYNNVFLKATGKNTDLLYIYNIKLK